MLYAAEMPLRACCATLRRCHAYCRRHFAAMLRCRYASAIIRAPQDDAFATMIRCYARFHDADAFSLFRR